MAKKMKCDGYGMICDTINKLDTISHTRNYFSLIDNQFEIVDSNNQRAIVVGWWSLHQRMWLNRATSLSNGPVGFMVKYFTPTGKLTKSNYIVMFWNLRTYNNFPRLQNGNIGDQWLENEFPLTIGYSTYMRHLYELAKEVVSEYSGYGWHGYGNGRTAMPSDVESAMYNNPFYCSLSANSKYEYNESLVAAHNQVLDSYAKMFKGSSSLEALFNAGMQTQTKDTSYADVSKLKKLNKEIKAYTNEMFKAHRYEDMHYEYEARKQAQLEFNKIIYDNYQDLPKTTIGTLNWSSIL